MNDLKALLVEGIHPVAADVLASSGIEVDRESRAMGGEELVSRLAGVQVLGLRSGTHVTAEVLAQAPDLRVIGAFCIGTNQIDLRAATERGIAVFNAPFSNTRSVVELAIAEIIALTRRLTVQDDAMHAGQWRKSAKGSHELRGRRLGIVGYGKIGSQLSVLAEALGMHVRFFDTADRLALGNARRCATLEELLADSDVVSLHVDGRPGNSGMFGDAQFGLMPRGAIFLNLSRGFLVDHSALRERIVSDHLAGAAVDVFPNEPAGPGDPFESELRGLPNVILTPHVGGSTEEAQQDIGDFVAGKLLGYLRAGATGLSVNLPEVQLPRLDGATRLLLLHRNQPGALAHLAGVLADGGLNVEQQLLTTSGTVGYAVTDVRGTVGDGVVDRLRGLPETIRLDLLTG
ncbi:phosphoglycerate dehydrogenase [Blastococcus saxobsidens]|uniref:D-3-phosphoglycerate dehydrogenase n=1 Tax=Blastococcus saxobsidens (strain DD2) TaxID=1146883 RepID=H6RKQ9_BLASD|nr:phosphoglycerate dehydrogenase [Blastococcus saxobsidens]CCG03675.1 D-3-phosphoglycerate dehydrogenase (PGDH) [Blastococcus saxobsidens DD2]